MVQVGHLGLEAERGQLPPPCLCLAQGERVRPTGIGSLGTRSGGPAGAWGHRLQKRGRDRRESLVFVVLALFSSQLDSATTTRASLKYLDQLTMLADTHPHPLTSQAASEGSRARKTILTSLQPPSLPHKKMAQPAFCLLSVTKSTTHEQ